MGGIQKYINLNIYYDKHHLMGGIPKIYVTEHTVENLISYSVEIKP
jgi:hypothetical protein